MISDNSFTDMLFVW